MIYNVPLNGNSLKIDIVSRYNFGCASTQAFPMCHQASFHLKFSRKYPLFEITRNSGCFKTGSGKKGGKKMLWYNS